MKWTVLLLCLTALLLVAGGALAMESDKFELDWFTPLTGGGGGTVGSIDYAVSFTVGQSATGTSDSTDYDACLGYWCGRSEAVTNQPPVADAGPDQTVQVLALVTLDGSGSSDPDDHLPLDYGWIQTGGSTVALSTTSIAIPTLTAPSNPAVLTFRLSVTDSLGLADPTPDEVVITVQEEIDEEHFIYLPLVLRGH